MFVKFTVLFSVKLLVSSERQLRALLKARSKLAAILPGPILHTCTQVVSSQLPEVKFQFLSSETLLPVILLLTKGRLGRLCCYLVNEALVMPRVSAQKQLKRQ